MQGLHLTGDLSDCQCAPQRLTDPALLQTLCLEAIAAAGLTRVNHLFHQFAPGSGITGVVLLAESHIALHTWPEMGGVTLDVYVCNYGQDNSAKAQGLFEAILQCFLPRSVVRGSLSRGAVAERVAT